MFKGWPRAYDGFVPRAVTAGQLFTGAKMSWNVLGLSRRTEMVDPCDDTVINGTPYAWSASVQYHAHAANSPIFFHDRPERLAEALRRRALAIMRAR
jgi:hypothetical protein